MGIVWDKLVKGYDPPVEVQSEDDAKRDPRNKGR